MRRVFALSFSEAKNISRTQFLVGFFNPFANSSQIRSFPPIFRVKKQKWKFWNHHPDFPPQNFATSSFRHHPDSFCTTPKRIPVVFVGTSFFRLMKVVTIHPQHKDFHQKKTPHQCNDLGGFLARSKKCPSWYPYPKSHVVQDFMRINCLSFMKRYRHWVFKRNLRWFWKHGHGPRRLPESQCKT